MSTVESTASQTTRYPLKGSCHCRSIQYLIYLELPPATLSGSTRTADLKQPTVRIRKCNCSTCHKIGFFHVRVPYAPDDFVLLSPLDPLNELGDYLVYDKRIHWLFCKTCAVRCFAFAGEGEVVEKDVLGEKKRVWVPKRSGYEKGNISYLSVNAQTIEPGQEGFDLKEWHEKKWVCYLDCLDEKEDDRFGQPHRGGTY